MSLTTVTPPAALPLSLAMVKGQLRLNGDDAAEDALLIGKGHIILTQMHTINRG